MIAQGSKACFIENNHQIAELKNIRLFLQVNICLTRMKKSAISAKASFLCQLSQDDREQIQRYTDNLNKFLELEYQCTEKLDFLLRVQIKYAGGFGYYEEQKMFEAQLATLNRHQDKTNTR